MPGTSGVQAYPVSGAFGIGLDTGPAPRRSAPPNRRRAGAAHAVHSARAGTGQVTQRSESRTQSGQRYCTTTAISCLPS